MIRCGGAAKGAKGGHVLWFVPARRMHANEKRPPFPNVNITHQAIRVCYRSKQSRLRPPRPPAQRREGLVSEAAVGHRPVQQMQDLSKYSMARRLQQVLIGRNGTSYRREAAHWSADNRSPTASKWPPSGLLRAFKSWEPFGSHHPNFGRFLDLLGPSPASGS